MAEDNNRPTQTQEEITKEDVNRLLDLGRLLKLVLTEDELNELRKEIQKIEINE
ncbi:hypothetical protein KA005_31945 [bacterium]|nr:hypothetical protein [bacterium]